MTTDDRPLSTRLEELRGSRGLTFRALESRLRKVARRGERRVTNGHLVGLAGGKRPVTPEVILLVARAFDLPPDSFVEWRLWQVQQRFDPRRSDGLAAAVAELHAFVNRSVGDVPLPAAGASRVLQRHARVVAGVPGRASQAPASAGSPTAPQRSARPQAAGGKAGDPAPFGRSNQPSSAGRLR